MDENLIVKWKSCVDLGVGRVLQQHTLTFQVIYLTRVFNAMILEIDSVI